MKTTRPSQKWRKAIAEEARELAAGTLDPECAEMTLLYPEPLIRAVDDVLARYETELAGLPNRPSDAEVLRAVEHVVVALNGVDEDAELGGSGFDTVDREDLFEYIYGSLVTHGVDVPALAARNGMEPDEITDEWREW
ncbi:hypothetical protein GCM10020367_66770 [Streptomyces sannanensis]|uniref:NTP pyrophosphohydrolase MazG putative catalytic core domain-containing protein n=1 Tax=Streptomyces sannanensis TaxID=285536 RepID=A0ABP6S3Q8_9ACTN